MSEAELRKKILLAQLTLVEEKIKTEQVDRAVKEKLNQLLERKINSFDALFNQTQNIPESSQQSASGNNENSVTITEVGQDDESNQRIIEEGSDNEYSRSEFFEQFANQILYDGIMNCHE